MALIDGLAGKNKRYNELRGRAQTGSDADKRATAEQMANILQGSAVGQIIQDRQALMGLLAMMNNRAYVKDIETKIDPRTGAAVGTGDANFDLMRGTAQFNAQALDNEKIVAQDAAFSKLMPALTSTTEGMTSLAREYPTLTTAVSASTTALTALAAAAGGSALIQVLTKGGAGVATGASAMGVGSRLLSTAGTVGKFVGRAALPVAIAANAWEAGSVMMDKNKSGADKKVAVAGAVGGIGGGVLGGMAAGAAIGSVVPVVGTAIGGMIGAALGAWGGKKLGEVTGEALFKRSEPGRVSESQSTSSPGTPASIEKKTTLEARYNLNVSGVGMKEAEDMINRRMNDWQRDQEARVRAAMHDGGD
jgi:hypothetical protein